MSISDPQLKRAEGLLLPPALLWTIGSGLIAIGVYVGSTVATTNAGVTGLSTQITGMRVSIEQDISDIKSDLSEMREATDGARTSLHQIELRVQRLEDKAGSK